MSQQKELLRELAAAHNSGVPDRIAIGSQRTSGYASRANRPCRWVTPGRARSGANQNPYVANNRRNP